jgi:taurine dioxygenase
MQSIHDMFQGMTVHTDESANRTQIHPVVRRNPETGRDALYVNQQYTIGLADFWVTEQKPLLDFLFAHATQDAFTCRWRWAVGDVAFWDNRVVQHMAMGDSTGHRRAMHRTTVAGETPIAATGSEE